MGAWRKVVPGFPNYVCYRRGQIWSRSAKRFLNPQPNNNFYLRVELFNASPQGRGKVSNGHRGKRFFVHRLVAILFHKNPKGKPEVNHLDWDKSNPHADNLEWATSSENKLHNRNKWKRKEEYRPEGVPF